MKLDVKSLTDKLKPVLDFLRPHLKLIFILALASIYGFLILRISQLSRIEPSETQIDEVLTEVRRPKVDKNAVAKIQELEDQNIEVQTLFKDARNNPFQE